MAQIRLPASMMLSKPTSSSFNGLEREMCNVSVSRVLTVENNKLKYELENNGKPSDAQQADAQQADPQPAEEADPKYEEAPENPETQKRAALDQAGTSRKKRRTVEPEKEKSDEEHEPAQVPRIRFQDPPLGSTGISGARGGCCGEKGCTDVEGKMGRGSKRAFHNQGGTSPSRDCLETNSGEN